MQRCRNNLRQFGIALHNYHDTFACMPRGIVAGSPDVRVGLHSGWIMLAVSRDASLDGSCLNPNDRVNEFRSAHPGGANFLWGDGTVRFISNSVDERIYSYLGTIRGGELDRDDEF